MTDDDIKRKLKTVVDAVKKIASVTVSLDRDGIQQLAIGDSKVVETVLDKLNEQYQETITEECKILTCIKFDSAYIVEYPGTLKSRFSFSFKKKSRKLSGRGKIIKFITTVDEDKRQKAHSDKAKQLFQALATGAEEIANERDIPNDGQEGGAVVAVLLLLIVGIIIFMIISDGSMDFWDVMTIDMLLNHT